MYESVDILPWWKMLSVLNILYWLEEYYIVGVWICLNVIPRSLHTLKLFYYQFQLLFWIFTLGLSVLFLQICNRQLHSLDKSAWSAIYIFPTLLVAIFYN